MARRVRPSATQGFSGPHLIALKRDLSSPARGEVKCALPFSRCGLHPSFATPIPIVCLQTNKGRRSAGRRHCLASRTTHPDVATCLRFGCGARHGWPGCPNRPLRARTPLGAPPRLSLKVFQALSATTPGQVSWDLVHAALATLSCPSPAEAPRAPVVMPADMMPEAARERFARPRAGTAPAPPSGSHPKCAFDGRANSEVSISVTIVDDGATPLVGKRSPVHNFIIKITRCRSGAAFLATQVDLFQIVL